VPYDAANNALIVSAERSLAPRVRINDVTLPSGAVLEFEVRFGANATSSKMRTAPPSGMIQVNLQDGNTRVVTAEDVVSGGPTIPGNVTSM
jgi:hypothetical protein